MVVKSKKITYKHIALSFDCLAIVSLVLYIASSNEIVDFACIGALIVSLIVELSYRLHAYRKRK